MLLSPPARRSPPPRRLPSPRRKEVEVRVGARPYVAPERDYTDAAQRYAHLYLSADFAKAVVHWPQVRAACVLKTCFNVLHRGSSLICPRKARSLVC